MFHLKKLVATARKRQTEYLSLKEKKRFVCGETWYASVTLGINSHITELLVDIIGIL